MEKQGITLGETKLMSLLTYSSPVVLQSKWLVSICNTGPKWANQWEFLDFSGAGFFLSSHKKIEVWVLAEYLDNP